VVSENRASSRGGAIFVTRDADVRLVQCVVEGNTATISGGGAYVDESAFAVLASDFQDNTVTSEKATAIYLASGTFQATAFALNGTIEGPFVEMNARCGSSCAPGYYSDLCSAVSGASKCVVNCGACTACPVGKASAEAGATSVDTCKDCSTGRAAPDQASTECVTCRSGTFAALSLNDTDGIGVVSGAAACARCPVGYHLDTPASTACITCPAGTLSNENRTNCDKCPAGTFSGIASSGCVDCEAGKYIDVRGSSVCLSCSLFGEGVFSAAGAVDCDECIAGYYRDPISGVCINCPTSLICQDKPGQALPAPKTGFWLDTTDSSYFSRSKFMVYDCPRLTCQGLTQLQHGGPCWSPNNITNQAFCSRDRLMCKTGNTGYLCGSCVQGYSYSTSSLACESCADGHLGGTIVYYLSTSAFAVFALMVYFDRLHIPKFAQTWWIVELLAPIVGTIRFLNRASFKIMMSTYQIIQSVTINLNVDFPFPFSTFLWCLNNIPLLTFDVLSFECYFEHSSYFYSVYIISLLPIVILAIIGFVAVARHSIAPSVNANARDSFAALFLSSLMLPPVSRKLLNSLNCVYFPHSNESLLSDDTSISCNSDSYARFKVFAVMILVIYLSVPLVWAVMLRNFTHNEEHERALQFLVADNRSGCKYAEVFEAYRKIAFCSVLPLLAASNSKRGALGVSFALVSLTVIRGTMPYELRINNYISEWAQFAVLLTYLSAVAIETNISSSLGQLELGIFLLVVNLSVFSLVVWLGYHNYQREYTNPVHPVIKVPPHFSR